MTTITAGWSNNKYFYFDIWSPEAVWRFPSMEIFILGSKCKGRWSLHGEGEEHLGSRSFISEQPSFCFCKNSELTVCSRAIINFAWLAWSRVLYVELLSECLGTLRPHPIHSYPWVSQNNQSLPDRDSWTLAWWMTHFFTLFLFLFIKPKIL